MTDYVQNDRKNLGVGEVFLSQSAKSRRNGDETLYPQLFFRNKPSLSYPLDRVQLDH